MTDSVQVLREVMRRDGVTQAQLSRISGVNQPGISQYLSGRVRISDDMLGRLLACMGYGLEVSRVAVRRELGRPARLAWLLHRQLACHLNAEALAGWRPRVAENLEELRRCARGPRQLRDLDRWQRMVADGDVPAFRHAMTGLDADSVQMREVSPLVCGILPQRERAFVLSLAGDGAPCPPPGPDEVRVPAVS